MNEETPTLCPDFDCCGNEADPALRFEGSPICRPCYEDAVGDCEREYRADLRSEQYSN
jgi:hypothetical protein